MLRERKKPMAAPARMAPASRPRVTYRLRTKVASISSLPRLASWSLMSIRCANAASTCVLGSSLVEVQGNSALAITAAGHLQHPSEGRLIVLPACLVRGQALLLAVDEERRGVVAD